MSARIPVEFPESGAGTYILILELPVLVSLQVGKLGTFGFAAGWYGYAGSAFGSGGLRGRLRHHLGEVKKPHWHIDYLRRVAPCREIWYAVSDTVYEHQWATVLNGLSGASVPIPRFGASDCRCNSHLIYFAKRPSFGLFHAAHNEPVYQWHVPD